MIKLVRQVEIKNLFDSKDIEWNLNDVNVLVGKNGAGKTTILQTIYGLLKQDANESISKSLHCKLTLENEGTIEHKFNNVDINVTQMLDFLNKAKKFKHLDNKNKNEVQKLIVLLEEKTKNSTNIKEIKFGSINASDEAKTAEHINVELISTVNMSANSIYEFKKSDGGKTTILDMEITSELERFKNLMNQEAQSFNSVKDALIETINDLFFDCDKLVNFIDGDLLVRPIKGGDDISFKILSSGERQLIYILLKAANTSLKPSVLLMDEPEISLHLAWQEKLISAIKKINENCQLIIVTHSPAIIMKGWMNAFVDIKSIQKDVTNG